jgi:hypothetical protein
MTAFLFCRSPLLLRKAFHVSVLGDGLIIGCIGYGENRHSGWHGLYRG